VEVVLAVNQQKMELLVLLGVGEVMVGTQLLQEVRLALVGTASQGGREGHQQAQDLLLKLEVLAVQG